MFLTIPLRNKMCLPRPIAPRNRTLYKKRDFPYSLSTYLGHASLTKTHDQNFTNANLSRPIVSHNFLATIKNNSPSKVNPQMRFLKPQLQHPFECKICKSAKTDPNKDPLWRLKSTKIVHKCRLDSNMNNNFKELAKNTGKEAQHLQNENVASENFIL